MSIFEFENAFLSEQTTPNCKIIKIDIKYNICFNALLFVVSRFGAVVKVVGSHHCGWGSIPAKVAVFSLKVMCVCVHRHMSMSVNKLIKSFCYHYMVEKLSDIFTIIRLAAGYKYSHQIKTNMFFIIVYSFIQQWQTFSKHNCSVVVKSGEYQKQNYK